MGGFGWFDPVEERFEIERPPEMADWSASAILVEDDAVWIGLKRRPEGAEYSGGLLRWDRAAKQAHRWANTPLIRELRRDGARLLAAGDGGAVVVVDGDIQTLFTDVDREGRYRLYAPRAQ